MEGKDFNITAHLAQNAIYRKSNSNTPNALFASLQIVEAGLA